MADMLDEALAAGERERRESKGQKRPIGWRRSEWRVKGAISGATGHMEQEEEGSESFLTNQEPE